MPTRRTSTRRPAPNLQSKLSFHGNQNKVTKSTSSPRDAKALKTDPALLDEATAAQDEKSEIILDDEEPTTTAAKAIAQQAAAEAPAADPLESTNTTSKTEDVLGGRAEQSTLGAVGGPSADTGWLGDEAERARKISEPQIKKYWRAKEAERLAPRVHQQDLSVHEKILREWDMSGQYGPCIGIARLKRWKRANMLGLQPPLEVLAVLLREMDSGVTQSQRAHVDELLSSRFIET